MTFMLSCLMSLRSLLWKRSTTICLTFLLHFPWTPLEVFSVFVLIFFELPLLYVRFPFDIFWLQIISGIYMTILSSSSTLCTSMYGKVLHKLFQEAEIQSNFIPYSILKKMNSMILHYSLESFILSNFSKELAAIYQHFLFTSITSST